MSDVQDTLRLLRLRWVEVGLGFEPESNLQVCFYLSEPAAGVQLYQHIQRPSKEDERWVGQCYALLGQREKAREHLMKAGAMGNRGAIVDLAFSLCTMGFIEEAEQELQSVEPTDLSEGDGALFYRCWGYIRAATGNQQQALAFSLQAWKKAQTAEEFKIISPRILMQIGQIYNNLRENDMALYYIRRAEQICINRELWNIKMSLAIILFENGRYDDALIYLEEVCERSESEILICASRTYTGRIEMIQGHLNTAIEIFTQVAEFCKKNLLRNVEVIARSYLITIYAVIGEEVKAYENLARAQQLARGDVFTLNTEMRKIHIDILFSRINIEDGISGMQKIMIKRKEDADFLEYLRSCFFLCEVLLIIKHPDAETKIKSLIEDIVTNDCKYYAAEDVIILSNIRKYLESQYADFFHYLKSEDKKIVLTTVDCEELLIDGEILHIPLRKFIEVISFILYKNRATLNEIITHVFQDSSQEKAKNYFHQIRHVLHEKTDQLRIEFDKKSKRYFVSTQITIEWDFQRILESSQPVNGIFLPSSGSDWVIELNQRLSE